MNNTNRPSFLFSSFFSMLALLGAVACGDFDESGFGITPAGDQPTTSGSGGVTGSGGLASGSGGTTAGSGGSPGSAGLAGAWSVSFNMGERTLAFSFLPPNDVVSAYYDGTPASYTTVEIVTGTYRAQGKRLFLKDKSTTCKTKAIDPVEGAFEFTVTADELIFHTPDGDLPFTRASSLPVDPKRAGCVD